MNGFGYLGKARQTKKQAAAAKNRPIASWGTQRLKKFVAAGEGKDWQLRNASIALRSRGVTVKQAGTPQAPPPVADDRPTVGQWTADGSRYWNGSAWVLPGTDTGGGTNTGGTTPTTGQWSADGSMYWNGTQWVRPAADTGGTAGGTGTTYNGSTGAATGWSGGADWSGGGDAWGDLYGSGGGRSSFAPSGGSSGAVNADGTPASGGFSGKTIAVIAVVGIGAYLMLRKKRGGK